MFDINWPLLLLIAVLVTLLDTSLTLVHNIIWNCFLNSLSNPPLLYIYFHDNLWNVWIRPFLVTTIYGFALYISIFEKYNSVFFIFTFAGCLALWASFSCLIFLPVPLMESYKSFSISSFRILCWSSHHIIYSKWSYCWNPLNGFRLR